MKYKHTVKGTFIARPNRFIAIVEINGQKQTVHVKNTGRCKELLIPGSTVILSKAEESSRKTAYDLIAVYKKGLGLVNIDSQAPNRAVKEWLEKQSFSKLQPEYKFGDSRLDFYLEMGSSRILMEVKGCTLEIDKTGYFPDAPTLRGTRHLKELAKAAAQGYDCYIAFVIQMPKVTKVLPNTATDPAFSKALQEAVEAGVKILYLPCTVTENEIKITKGQTNI